MKPRSQASIGAPWFLGITLVALAFGLAWTAWLSDDAFITFRSLDQFVHGNGLRWNAAERVQAFTNPLWLFLLAPFYALSGSIAWTAILAGWIVTAAAVALLIRSASGAAAAAFGVLLFAGSKAFLEYSTSGLENPLLHLALLGCVASFLGSLEGPARAGRVALWTSIAFLSRPDAALFTGVLCVAAWLAAPTWKTSRRMLLGWTPALAWEGFSIVYFGTWVPNTAIAKLSGGLPAHETWSQGLSYLANSLAWDPVTLLTVAAAATLSLFRPPASGGRARVVAFAMVLHLVYVTKVGGDFMTGRFLTGPMVVAVALLVRRSYRPGGIAIAAIAIVSVAALHPRSPWGPRPDALAFQTANDPNGITDERAVYYAYTGLLSKGHPAWGRLMDGAPYPPATDARARFESGERIQRHTQVGLTGFFAPRDLHIIDIFGLADPLLARLPLTNSGGQPIFRHRIGPSGRFWRIGHLRRGPPPGYVASLKADENRLSEPSLARYYDAIRALTREPLWSAKRWRTWLDFQLGNYDADLAQWRSDQAPRTPKK